MEACISYRHSRILEWLLRLDLHGKKVRTEIVRCGATVVTSSESKHLYHVKFGKPGPYLHNA